MFHWKTMAIIAEAHPCGASPLSSSHSRFGLNLVNPTLEGGIPHPYKTAIGVMDA